MLLTLSEAALKIRPDGLVSARSLRAEIAAGRLRSTRIAGRIFVAEADLDDFVQAARQTAPAPRGRTPADIIVAKQVRSRVPNSSSAAHLAAVANGLTRRKG